MRVLFLAYQYPPYLRVYDGISIYVHNLTRALSRIGCEIHVAAFGPVEVDRNIEGVKVHFFKEPHPPVLRDVRLFFSTFKKTSRLCRKYKIDLVHGNSPFCLGYGLMRSRELPYILTVHGIPLGEILAFSMSLATDFGFLTVFNLFMRLFYLPITLLEWKCADRIIAVSRALAEAASSLFKIPKSKIEVILHGVSAPQNLAMNSSRPSDHVILFVGRLIWTKGIFYLIKAMLHVLEKYPDAKLWVVGDGSYRKQMENLVEKLEIQRSVKFLGEKPASELYSLYAQASIVVQPSLYESCGIAILEAMGMGKPIVASSVGGIPELIKNGKEGLLVRPSSSFQLANAIEKIFSDNALGKKLGTRARNKAEKEFDWSKRARETLRVYEEVMNG